MQSKGITQYKEITNKITGAETGQKLNKHTSLVNTVSENSEVHAVNAC